MLDTNKCHGLTCWITSDDKVVAKELDMPDESVLLLNSQQLKEIIFGNGIGEKKTITLKQENKWMQ